MVVMLSALGPAGCIHRIPVPRTDYAGIVLSDAPLAFWRLGETQGSVAADSSGNRRDGSYIGAVQHGASGARFDGSPDGVLIPFGRWMEPGELTVEAWVVPSRVDYPEAALVVDKGNVWGLSVQANGTPAFALPFSTGQAVGLVPLIAGRLYHLVGTYAARTISLYVNGQPVARVPADAMRRTSEPLHIGRGLAERRFQLEGTVRDVAIYDRVLPDARVRAHHRALVAELCAEEAEHALPVLLCG